MTQPLAFVFPGQGSQKVGMLTGLPLWDEARSLLERASSHAGRDLVAVAAEGPEADLADTRVAQPLLYVAGWAWATALQRVGVRPGAVAGHSLGELTALAVAGVYDVADGLELVCERARLMGEAAAAAPGSMAAVLGMDAPTISDVIGLIGGVWMANDNAPGQIVISGTREGIEHAIGALTGAGARRVVPLAVAGAFHSPLMAGAADAFATRIASVAFRDARVPVYQNAGPSRTVEAAGIAERLAGQMTSPVRWTETMSAMHADGISTLVECGPGAVLSGLARRVDGLDAISTDGSSVSSIREAVA